MRRASPVRLSPRFPNMRRTTKWLTCRPINDLEEGGDPGKTLPCDHSLKASV